MPVQAYVDDSGGKGQGGHFVLAGLIAESDSWTAFSEEWRLCLSQEPAIAYFKMREAAALSGCFYRFTEKDRDTKLRLLARIIGRYAKLATYSAIDLKAHGNTWAVTNSKPLSEPYFFPFHTTILAACFELWDLGWRERFEIIFDEQVVFGPRTKAWYPLVRDLVEQQSPEEGTILPVDPIFRTDDEFMPLQAADMFAWCWRKSAVSPGEPGPYSWLWAEMPTIKVSEYSQLYDMRRLQSVTDQAKEITKTISLTDPLVLKYREELRGKPRKTSRD